MTHPPPSARERTAWCLFDFANSSFTTVIITVVFGRVFVDSIARDHPNPNMLWAVSIAVANLISLVVGPVLGTWVDAGMGKRRPLLFSWAACCVLTAALGCFGEGDATLAIIVVTAANLAFCLGENLIASFLPELAPPDKIGRLSARGWATGYVGGLLALLLALFLVRDSRVAWVPAATALFFFIGGLPTAIFLRDRGRVSQGPLPRISAAFDGLRKTWRDRKQYPDLGILLLTLFLVQGGVSLVIGFSALFARDAINMGNEEVIVLFIVIQIAAAVGAMIFGVYQDLRGSRAALFATTYLWIVATIISLSSGTALMNWIASHVDVNNEDTTRRVARTAFWIGALLAGAAMGSSQSAGRAMVGVLSPPGREAEWFGLWGVSTKASAFVSALVLALLTTRFTLQTAMASTLVFFVAGLFALRNLDENRGRSAAGRLTSESVIP